MNKLKFFEGFKDGFRSFPYTVTNIINFVLLLVVYIFGIGIVAIISKLFGKHYLDLKKTQNRSNWKEHKVTKQPLEDYCRTF